MHLTSFEPSPAERVERVENDVILLQGLIAELNARITVLTAALPAAGKPRDELNDKIVELLGQTGILMDPLSIAANLGVRNEIVSPRCATMANKGTIGRRKIPGKNPLYYALPAGATPVAGSQ